LGAGNSFGLPEGISADAMTGVSIVIETISPISIDVVFLIVDLKVTTCNLCIRNP
jgi:hypothetical protein